MDASAIFPLVNPATISWDEIALLIPTVTVHLGPERKPLQLSVRGANGERASNSSPQQNEKRPNEKELSYRGPGARASGGKVNHILLKSTMSLINQAGHRRGQWLATFG